MIPELDEELRDEVLDIDLEVVLRKSLIEAQQGGDQDFA